MRGLSLAFRPLRGLRGAAVLALLVLTACGSAAPPSPTPPPTPPHDFSAEFEAGPIVFAMEAAIQLVGDAPVESVGFAVHTKPGNLSDDVRVTYARSYLDRTHALDEVAKSVRVPVFGLYADFDNEVTVEITFQSAEPLTRTFTVPTPAVPEAESPPVVAVHSVALGLGMSFMLLQGRRTPTIFDIDGEVRWQGPEIGEVIFARARTADGFLVGARRTPTLYQIDWLGRTQVFPMSDPRYTGSHHNIEPGKTGYLNTITFDDGVNSKPLSVLAEMSATGVVTGEWDFDLIFQTEIEAHGEDPSLLVKPGQNWFHMNSAIYDASDDSVIASSRENFVVKADHATGAIKWILGNPAKVWYRDLPLSMQPLALTVVGDPPVGQHALSVSPDGKSLMLFNNGKGNGLLEDVGDTRTYSKVSIYAIDTQAHTATETWSYDFNQEIYSPVCSSAYRTLGGNVLTVCSSPDEEGALPRFFVINDAQDILFEATIDGLGCQVSYAAEEIPLGTLQFE